MVGHRLGNKYNYNFRIRVEIQFWLDLRLSLGLGCKRVACPNGLIVNAVNEWVMDEIRVIPKLLKHTNVFRWFAIAYLITVFLLIPGFLIALSFVNILFYIVVGLIIALILFIVILNLLQKYFKPRFAVLQSLLLIFFVELEAFSIYINFINHTHSHRWKIFYFFALAQFHIFMWTNWKWNIIIGSYRL